MVNSASKQHPFFGAKGKEKNKKNKMPTLRSTGVHPTLCKVLSGVEGPTKDERTETAEDGAEEEDHDDDKKRDCPKTPTMTTKRHAPILTPQALLSRDPSQICSILSSSAQIPHGGKKNDDRDFEVNNNNKEQQMTKKAAVVVPLSAVLRLRASVARAMIRDPILGHGHAAEETKRRADMIDSTMRKRWRQDEETEHYQNFRPVPIVEGAVTALDLCLDSASSHSSRTQHHSIIKTGSLCLDALLAPPAHYDSEYFGSLNNDNNKNNTNNNNVLGGIRVGFVTEVYGPPASGKTQLALSIASAAATTMTTTTTTTNSGSCAWHIHYLTAGGGGASAIPLARRCKQLCRSRLSSFFRATNKHKQQQAPREFLQSALDRISFTSVPNACAALAALASMEQSLLKQQQQHSPTTTTYTLIILDSASACLASNSHGTNSIGAAWINDVSLALRRLTRTFRGVAVFTTNGTVSVRGRHRYRVDESVVAAALGTTWRGADISIRLDIVRDEYDTEGNDESAFIAASGSAGASSSAGAGLSLSLSPPDVPGLVMASRRIVRATLERHWAKSVSHSSCCSVEFAVDGTGIVDV